MSLKKVEIPDDNLNEYFSSSQNKNSQETADVTPTELQRSQKEQNQKMCPKVPAVEGFTSHLKAWLVKVPLSLPPS